MADKLNTFSVFSHLTLIARGDMREIIAKSKMHLDHDENIPLAIYDDERGVRLDIDFRGDIEEIMDRLVDHPLMATPMAAPPAKRGRGRPKLGVMSREVSLLPRHWDWLASHQSGASATLRRLVDAARKEDGKGEQRRRIEGAAHRFMWDMAGDLPGFEEVSRAFYRRDYDTFEEQVAAWPKDIAEHVMRFVRALKE